MIAVLMAGGKGTRLVGITKDMIPKPMAPLMGKPILQWQIEQLKENGIKEFILIVGHLGEAIEAYFGDGSSLGVTIRYYHEECPLGTAGALSEILPMLNSEPFFLGFGDILFNIDLDRMVAFHKSHEAEITLFAHPNDHPEDSDVLVLDENQRVTDILKKNQPRKNWYDNCVNAGIFIAEPSFCNRIVPGMKTDLEKNVIIPLISEGGAVYGYTSPEYVKDIGTVERIKEAEKALETGMVQRRNLRLPQRAVFLDRDGTINKLNGLVYKDEQLVLEKNAAKAIREINCAGWLAIVITNQPSVARGLCQVEDIERLHRKLQTLLGQQGAYLDAICFCPHHPEKGFPEENLRYKIPCHCRKPNIGMIEQCVERFHIDLAASWFVGDTTVDIQTGLNAGMHTAMVRTGEAGGDCKYPVTAEIEAIDLLEAVKQIVYLNKE